MTNRERVADNKAFAARLTNLPAKADCIREEVEGWLGDDEWDGGPGPLLADLPNCYCVVTRTDYDNQEDEYGCTLFASLEESKAHVEEHLFQEAGLDYTFRAQVYDLDAGREVDYEVVQEIRWT